jgi:hypothetical protein
VPCHNAKTASETASCATSDPVLRG